ncbi:glycosyltransferase [Cellulomonas endophytica]|uniref:glycosyltransferase n=1 Tax=Cellulomonas endophytica TaxID=2494735 RepID=UPI0010121999|nr:glycosyltransferase [Cellulomonas endophytica]
MTETLVPVEPTSTTTASLPVLTPVTAVLVTRGVTHYLPRTLGALADGVRRPARVLVVDVGPVPAPGLAEAAARTLAEGAARAAARGTAPGTPPGVRVIPVPGAATFGAAVRAALAADPGAPTEWLWLLHDDSAPAPPALAELVRAVAGAPSVGVAGAKQRTWTDPERLLEVGVRLSRSGRRVTGVEVGELDQGQHDGADDVLAVGLAGALVRRRVWDELEGPDPALGPFGDGVDLCRRARLAGHRVVVVPSAVVRHAQASYLGLRGADRPGDPRERTLETDLDGDGEPDVGDPRRSYRARRRAQLHLRATGTAAPLVPFVLLAALASALVRLVVRTATKEPGLARDEVAAVLGVLVRPGALMRGRARARTARRLPRRTLRPLQAPRREVLRQWRDLRLARREERRVVVAPSEIELAELAALTTRRRFGLALLLVVALGTAAAAAGPLLGAVAAGGRLVGRALPPVTGGLGDLWAAATSGWTTAGLGSEAPADALLAALLPGTVLTGGSPGLAVAGLVLGGTVLAAWGAWAAAGAATRSVGLRLWAGLVWAVAPALLLPLGDGRVGAVLAHVALPWAALGLARTVGVARGDRVRPAVTEPLHLEGTVTPVGGVPVLGGAGPDGVPGATSSGGAGADGTPPRFGSAEAAAGTALALVLVLAGAPVLLAPVLVLLVVVALAAPRGRGRVLLTAVPALVVLAPVLAAAAAADGAAALRLLLAAPGTAVPTAPAAGAGAPSEGGVALPDAVLRLLGVPAEATALLPGPLPDAVRAWAPAATGLVVLVLALVALLRGREVARGVRLGWLAAALGLAVATLAAALPVAAVDGAWVRGDVAPAVGLAAGGLLAAAVLGADGTRERLRRAVFGWRQPVAVGAVVVAVLVPAAQLTGWVWAARTGAGPALAVTDRAVVPAVGQGEQTGAGAARVLALLPGSAVSDPAVVGPGALPSGAAGGTGTDPAPDVVWQLLRGDGPGLGDASAAAATGALVGGLTDPAVRAVGAGTAEVDAAAAALAAGSGGDVAGALGALAVADVLVPPVPAAALAAADAGDAAGLAAVADRVALVGRLDATAGLERVTDGEAGTLWRVRPAGAAGSTGAAEVVTAWARLVPAGTATPALADPATPATAVPAVAGGAAPTRVATTVAPGDGDRLLVLAETASPGWRAWLDGRELAAADAGWRQAFAVPAEGGRLVVAWAPAGRGPLVVAASVLLVLAAVLALPLRRRRAGRR